MKVCAHLISLFVLLFLTSCSNYSQYLNNERQLKICHLQCNAGLDKCKTSCRNNLQECEVLSSMQAGLRFKKYKMRQINQGIIVNEELQSFKDPLQCRKVTCSCLEDFRVCKQACRGKIYKYL